MCGDSSEDAGAVGASFPATGVRAAEQRHIAQNFSQHFYAGDVEMLAEDLCKTAKNPKIKPVL